MWENIKYRKNENKKSAQLLSNLTNKKAYNILILNPPISQIKVLNTGISETDLPHLYLIPFVVTSKTKLSIYTNTKCIEDITRFPKDMDFIFEWQKYLTSSAQRNE